MPTRRIPHEHWQQYLDAFTRTHLWSPSVLEVIDETMGDQIEVARARLQGAVTEPRSRPESIEILLEGEGGTHLAHIIRDPVQVQVMDTKDHQTLRVESRDGGVTLLRLLPA